VSRADILIVGQGLAGTLLAFELERAGLDFHIVDRGPAHAASSAAAGLLNPITGRRLVRSWRYDALLPLARETYRTLETALGVPLWREMRVRRLFADDRERAVFTEKFRRGELAPYVTEAADASGFWIHGAARVDLPALLAAARARWQRGGKLTTADPAWPHETSASPSSPALMIDCTGAAVAARADLGFVPWEYSKGEMLECAVEGLAPDVIVNRRHWLAPISPGVAWIGATHEPGQRDPTPSSAGRTFLERSAADLLAGRTFAIIGQRAGVRVNLPDKRPVAGRHPTQSKLGLINGLGAKGALWAPFLARQWTDHLARGLTFDPEIDVQRFAGGSGYPQPPLPRSH
jgi:glycine oxidase